MQRTNLKVDTWHPATVREFAVLAILLLGCFPASTMAQQPGQKTFSSAEEASSALVAAMQSKDEKALLELLGADAKQLISSGDEIEDLHARANFVQRYLEMHRLVNEPDGTTTLYIGARNWPTPIPLVHKANAWYFETEAGKREILYANGRYLVPADSRLPGTRGGGARILRGTALAVCPGYFQR